jgi:hypothetical protein
MHGGADKLQNGMNLLRITVPVETRTDSQTDPRGGNCKDQRFGKKIGHSGLGLSIITQSLDYAGSGLDNLLSS